VKINRVEVKNITPPRDIQMAMEKQMRAERERRETILRAEGEKKAAILVAEGNKQARILEAEGTKEQQILEATGQADAIRLVQKATAEGVIMINESHPSEQVMGLKSLEAFAKAANGRATKIIIPSNIQALAGLATSVAELVRTDDETGAPAQTPPAAKPAASTMKVK
jgi:regulator of protease activity HflC (stomatin/prohibitin superfamily)